jgi:sarcosine oxidase
LVHDVVILGAGIHGLCAAFALRRRGRDVTVIDRFVAGHDRGGSHGAARITRSSYHDRRYVELARRSQSQGWPLLEAELGRQLVHATPGVFFGPPRGLFAEFLRATLHAGVDVEQIDLQTARRAFPLLRFDDEDAIMLDRTAGVLAAHDTMVGLREWLSGQGVEFRDSVAVTRLQAAAQAIGLDTDAGKLKARAVVVATGAWLGELLPEWQAEITALRQHVGYVQVAAPQAAIEVGAFPVWCRIGEDSKDFAYGLPEFGGPGLKLAQHRTVGVADDANVLPQSNGTVALASLATARLTVPVISVLRSEHCMYAVTPQEQLHVVRSKLDPRIVAVAACSGHGFKFGPVIGEQVADLISAP